MKIILTNKCMKQLHKIDGSIRQQIFRELDKIEKLQNPRAIGKALKGKLLGLWRYRCGDYRIFCRIDDEQLIIYAIKIGHRKDVYLN